MCYGQGSKTEKDTIMAELNVLQKLKHDNIVGYFDHIDDINNATMYIIMEYCANGDLELVVGKLKNDRYVLHIIPI